MITATTFWDKIADKYAKHPIKDMAAYEHKLAKTREYFTPNAQVLEFGCGTGSTALLHAPYVKAYRAIDISPRMIDIAKSKPLPAEPCALSFETSSLEALDASPETYDAILGLSILHLLEDPDRAVAQVYSLLKPGGILVTSTACLGGRYRFLKPLIWIGQRLGKAPKVAFFSQAALEEKLVAQGLFLEYRWAQPKTPALFLIMRKPLKGNR